MRNHRLAASVLVALAVCGANMSRFADATEPIFPLIADETAEGNWESVAIDEQGEVWLIRLGVFVRSEKSFLTACRASAAFPKEEPWCDDYELKYVLVREGALLTEGSNRVAGKVWARVELAGTGTAVDELGRLKARLAFKDVHGLELDRIEVVLVRQHPSLLDRAAAALKSFRRRAK